MDNRYAQTFTITTGIALIMWFVDTNIFSYSGVEVDGWKAWVILFVVHLLSVCMYMAHTGGLFNLKVLEREKSARPKWGQKSLSARMEFYSKTTMPGAIASTGFVAILINLFLLL